MAVGGTATRPEGRTSLRRLLAEAGGLSFGKDGECPCWMQEDHPARLRPTDLANPEEFRQRLGDWCREQR
ncbi:MAG: hypothetical protein HY823_10315 [Acidobacteria bacterium]|nr:hypothetical protein [Acidobacteriota bacterium]